MILTVSVTVVLGLGSNIVAAVVSAATGSGQKRLINFSVDEV